MDAKRIATIPLFSGLSKSDRRQVARFADEIDVPAGKQLVEEGEFGYEFFVIAIGTAEVSRGGERVNSLGPGDFFGEIALLETERRTATVVATSPMRLIVVTRRDFKHLARELPAVAGRVHATIRERLASS